MITICGECSNVHDITHCQGHNRTTGQQCGARPENGHTTCYGHRRAEEVIQRANGTLPPDVRPTERMVKMIAGVVVTQPIENPLAELQALAGEAKAWMRTIGERVQQLWDSDEIRYATPAGEQMRTEAGMWERSIERFASILTVIAKLNIDERLVTIEENKRDMVIAAIEAGLAKAGITGPDVLIAKAEVVRRLRVVPDPPRQIAA